MPSSARSLVFGMLGLACAACDRAQPLSGPQPYFLTASGRLDSYEEARFLAAERDAILRRVLVKPGQEVTSGEALAVLSCADLDASVEGAMADAAAEDARARLVVVGPRIEERQAAQGKVRSAAAIEEDARDQLQRARELADKGFVSARRLEEMSLRQRAAAGALDQARAELRAIVRGSRPQETTAAIAGASAARSRAKADRASLEKCTLRSPLSGTVVRVLKREGEFSGASAGTPILVVADLSRLIVRAEIPDRDAARVRVGSVADIWLDGHQRRHVGKVVELSNLMGRKVTRSLDPSDRFDRDVREAIIEVSSDDLPKLIGLRVNVGIRK